jgi:hypothetical protein
MTSNSTSSFVPQLEAQDAVGTAGKVQPSIDVPRARLNGPDGKRHGVEEPSVADLPAPHARCRRVDR